MAAAVRRYSLANPPPVEGELSGHETAHEAEILELQALQAERDGEGGRSVLLMERALQIRCRLVNQLQEKCASVASGASSTSSAGAHRMSVLGKPDAVGKEELFQEYQAQCSGLYDAAERLVVRCNELGVDHFKRDAFAEASPLLEYAMQLTEDDAYPLCEVEERRRHLRGVTLNNLGCMERRRGHFSEALQYMKSSMEMTGVESPVAYMNTSAILIQLRLSDEAVRMAERSIELLYQTPEDPSLLAVAHHNLAMALEPVDPARCLEEYALAYRTAFSTLGPESETTRSIQRSWRRYEMTRVSRPTAPFFIPSGGAAASHLREFAGAAPIRHAATAPHRLPATLPPQTRKGKSARANGPMDVMELFPHPFLPCSTAPSAPAGAQRNVTPIYRPTALPRRSPVPEWKPGVTAALSSRSRVPDLQSHQQRQQQRRQNGTEKVLRPSPPASRAAAATTRQPPANRANEAAAAAASSGRVATATTPSPPPSRQRDAVASRRYSRATRAQEPLLQSPLRTGTRQQDFSVKKSTMTASSTADMPVKRENSASRYVHGRLTVQVTPTALSSFAAQPPGRGSLLTARENGNGKPSTTMPPPRNLPPLQAAAALESPAVAPRRSCTRSSRSVAASEPLPPTSAPFSLESDPLSFLQNRLEVLLQDEEELEHKYLHATVIQRYYRGHLGRRRVAALRATRASYGRLAQLRRNMAARRIQRAFRHRRRDSRYPLAGGRLGRYAAGRGWRGVQHHAATQLQRIARSWLARRRYAQLRKYALESPLAASRIQRWIRALLARRRYAALRAEKAHEEAEALELERRQYAATRIQSQWLTHLQRRACKAALCNRMMARAAEDARRRVSAAIRIQSAWRGHQARQLYRDTYSRTFELRKARLEHERRRHAAVKLQSFGRMLITKQQAMPLLTAARVRAAAEIQTRSREGRAATTIQCAYRSHVARRVCATKRARRRELICQGLLQVHTAAVQRAGRGFLARRSVGVKLSALQTEADRYERLLQALQGNELDTASSSQHVREPHLYAIRDSEIDERGVLELAEQQQRHRLRRQYSASLPAATKPPAAQKLRRDIFSPPLHDFTLIIKAKQQRADRSRARDDYLDRCTADDAEAHEKASARVIADFMLSAAARKELLAAEADASAPERPLTAEQIAGERKELDRLARKELLAAEADASAPERPLTAEQIAGERKELDRLARKELLAAPERPLTAEQIAGERKELDRLARKELLAAEADASAPERPLTAEQIAGERKELDRLARKELLAAEAGASAPERPLTAEQIAGERKELDRLARKELLAAEADASAPERPLTAEQIAGERKELDRLARKELLAAEAGASAPERPLTAEQIAGERKELDRLARKELLAAEAGASAPERPLTAEQIAGERKELDRLARKELLAAEAGASAPERPLTAEQIAGERKELDRLARKELLAAEAGASAPERPLTAEQIAGERKELDRLARKELLAAEADASAPERPLTAEQIAGERKELDRLARKELLAAEAGASAPERPLTAEQIAGERKELDRLARKELLAAEADASAPERPLTAEQIAGERKELDRLARKELLAAEADASAPERPLTAEQIAGERKELWGSEGAENAGGECLMVLENFSVSSGCSLCTVELACEMLARKKAVWQAEVCAERRHREEAEALHRAAFDYRQQRIFIAEEEADLAPFRMRRSRLEKPARGEKGNASAVAAGSSESSAGKYRPERAALERAAVWCIERYFIGWWDRKFLTALQRMRDEYLNAMQEFELHDGPVLTNVRLREVLARYPDLRMGAKQSATSGSPSGCLKVVNCRPSCWTLAAWRSRKTLRGFARLIKAKQQRADRSRARDDYLDRCTADDAEAHEKASARVIADFMLSAAARSTLLRRAETMSAYNDARVMQEEVERESMPQRLAEQQVVAERLALGQLGYLAMPTECWKPGRADRTEQTASSDAALRAQKIKDARCSTDAGRTSTSSSSRPLDASEQETLSSGEARGRLCAFAMIVRDKRDLRQRQAARDAYLQDMRDESTSGTDEEMEHDKRLPTSSAGARTWTRAGETVCSDVTGMVDHEAMLQLYCQERRLFASSLLGGFTRIIKAKQQRADRSRARDDYLDRCTADDAEAHEKASARVIADFMLSAAARSTLLRRAETMSAYNDARVMQEEVEGAVDAVAEFSGEAASEKYSEIPQLPRAASPAVRRIQRFVRGVQARVHLRALQEACSAYLEEELAVEELLYSAALTIQRMFRCHLARRQAAEAIAQDHACLPSHKEERRSADGGLGALGHDALSSEVLSLFAPSSKGVVSGGAESVATSALSPRRASSTLSVGVRELTSTALVTVVNEAKEAVRN
ncbi:hypothetical protein LSCM4_03009 [Leishmania orientalis]|uniref:Flagellar Member 7 n=1 Tax=Leishmania orientalis TaxID=2249476 RepID=A0A836KBH0_9TRYP|nr:hypothetical protein LSCM4_03009 [Leishmania orientalis]